MRAIFIAALAAWIALVLLQEIMMVRERRELQRRAEAQEEMWKAAHEKQAEQIERLELWEQQLMSQEMDLMAQWETLAEQRGAQMQPEDPGTTSEGM